MTNKAECPSEVPARTRFPNKAGDHADTDDILRAELKAAGIPTLQEDAGKEPDYMADTIRRLSGEVKSGVFGVLHGWTFKRAWYYWMCEGPGIDVNTAEALHATHGNDVRVDGHCGCPSPRKQHKGLAVGNYHVDTAEGLKALADTIKALVNAPAPSALQGAEPVAPTWSGFDLASGPDVSIICCSKCKTVLPTTESACPNGCMSKVQPGPELPREALTILMNTCERHLLMLEHKIDLNTLTREIEDCRKALITVRALINSAPPTTLKGE